MCEDLRSDQVIARVSCFGYVKFNISVRGEGEINIFRPLPQFAFSNDIFGMLLKYFENASIFDFDSSKWS